MKMRINVQELVKNKKMYPNWTTGATYRVESEKADNETVNVYYSITRSAVPREISRTFPSSIVLTPKLLWTLGFLKGEGSNAKNKSNYRRFTITNTDAKILCSVLDTLEASKLLERSQIIDGGINIFCKNPSLKVIQFWSEELLLPARKFKLFTKSNVTSDMGVCHIYVSDVLLRRVVDLIQDEVLSSSP